jgi:phosphomannomutase
MHSQKSSSMTKEQSSWRHVNDFPVLPAAIVNQNLRVRKIVTNEQTKVIMSISPDGDRTIAVELDGNWLARTNATSFVSASSRSLVNSDNVATSSWLIF